MTFVCGLGFDALGICRELFSDKGSLLVRVRENNDELIPFAAACNTQPKEILSRWHDWLVSNLVWHTAYGKDASQDLKEKARNVEKAVVSLSLVLTVMSRSAA